MTNKKLKIKLSARNFVIVGLALVILSGGLIVKAYSNESSQAPTTVIENAGGVTINNPVPPAVEVKALEQPLGAGSGPISEWQYQCTNSDCTYFLTQPFIDASTTISVFVDPFLTVTSTYTPNTPLLEGDTSFGYVGATSTIEMAQVVITGVSTSTFDMSCALATSRYNATTTPVLIDLEASKVATSTIGIIRSGMTSSTNPGMGSLVSRNTAIANGEMSTQIMFTPAKPYFVCSVWPIEGGDLGGILGNSNTFDGIANIRVSRPRY